MVASGTAGWLLGWVFLPNLASGRWLVMIRGFLAMTTKGLNSELILVLDSVSVALGQDSTLVSQ